jgi:hypothetical protein
MTRQEAKAGDELMQSWKGRRAVQALGGAHGAQSGRVQGKLSPGRSVEFQEVVGGAHDTPFSANLLDAS